MFHPETIGKPDYSKNSLQVTHDGAKAHCWSCDWHGSWKKVAKKLNVDPGAISYDSAGAGDALKSSLKEEQVSSVPPDVTPWRGNWRKLHKSFLEPLAYSWRCWFKNDRILFPDYQQDGVIWVAGLANPEDRKDKSNRKWLNAPGMLSVNHMFGEQLIENAPRVAIVEGPYDALRLHYHGIPAIASLGTSAWTEKKAKRVVGIGVEEAVVIADGDKAGRKFNRFVKQTLSAYIHTWSIKLPEDQDPGNVPIATLRTIRNILLKKGWFRDYDDF